MEKKYVLNVMILLQRKEMNMDMLNLVNVFLEI